MRLSIINSSINGLKNADMSTLAEGTFVYEAQGFVNGIIPVNIMIFDYKGKKARVDCYHHEHGQKAKPSWKAKRSTDIAEVKVVTTKHCFQGNEFDVNVIEVRHTFTTMLRQVINEFELGLTFHKEYEDLHGDIWKNVYARKEERKDFYNHVSAETIYDRKLNKVVETGNFIDFSNND